MEWPRPSSKSPPTVKPTGSAITNGSGFCSIARRPGGRTSASRRGCASPNCASRRASRMSITEAPAVLTARCSKSWSRASGSTPTTIWSSSVRRASAKVGWPQRLATKPVATIGRSSISEAPRLFEDLALARGDGRHPRILRNLGRADLLILDDWGLEPLDAAARHDLLEILEERYGRRSSVITSQLPIDRWHEIIGDPTYADAILDRLIHNAHRIELAGESLRRTQAKQARKA